jgi:exonuclease VII small subunit
MTKKARKNAFNKAFAYLSKVANSLETTIFKNVTDTRLSTGGY